MDMVCIVKFILMMLMVIKFLWLITVFRLSHFLKLKYSWCTILCYFQMYNIMICQSNTLWNNHHSKSSNHLSPYKIITILLTIFLMLYITSPWHVFTTENLYLFFCYVAVFIHKHVSYHLHKFKNGKNSSIINIIWIHLHTCWSLAI